MDIQEIIPALTGFCGVSQICPLLMENGFHMVSNQFRNIFLHLWAADRSNGLWSAAWRNDTGLGSGAY